MEAAVEVILFPVMKNAKCIPKDQATKITDKV
jgi:hypothetical protein